MGKAKGPHHRGTHQVRARRIVEQANANPNTRCGRCNRTLAQHPMGGNGKPQYWTAGHVHAGQINGELRPEASTCNFGAGNQDDPDPNRWW